MDIILADGYYLGEKKNSVIKLMAKVSKFNEKINWTNFVSWL